MRSLNAIYSEIAYRNQQVPTMRVGQFLTNFIEFVKSETGHDIFYMSDEDLSVYMSRFVDSLQRVGKKG